MGLPRTSKSYHLSCNTQIGTWHCPQACAAKRREWLRRSSRMSRWIQLKPDTNLSCSINRTATTTRAHATSQRALRTAHTRPRSLQSRSNFWLQFLITSTEAALLARLCATSSMRSRSSTPRFSMRLSRRKSSTCPLRVRISPRKASELESDHAIVRHTGFEFSGSSVR